MRTEAIPMEQLGRLLAVQLEQGLAPLRVTGCSMHPMLRDKRDTVFLRKVDEPLRKGDLILYRREDGNYVLHRIVAAAKDGSFICSGDHQYISERVEPGWIIAVVDSFCRGKKTVSSKQPVYCAYVWAWVGLFPVRKPFLVARQALGRLRRGWKQR